MRDRLYGNDDGRKGILTIFGYARWEGELLSGYRGQALDALY